MSRYSDRSLWNPSLHEPSNSSLSHVYQQSLPPNKLRKRVGRWWSGPLQQHRSDRFCFDSATEQSTQQWCVDFPDVVGSLVIINNIPFNCSRWKQDTHCFCESSQHSTLWAILTWQNVTKWLCGRLPQGRHTDMLHFTRCLLRRLWRHSLLQGAFSEDSGAIHLHPPHPHYHLPWHFLTGLWKAAREEWLCLLLIGDGSKLYGTCGISKCLRIPALRF